MNLRYRQRPAHGRRAAAWALLVTAGLIADTSEASGQAEDIVAPPAAVVPESLYGKDSVTATPGQFYRAGPVHRFFFGDLRRDLWEVAFTLPVLNFDSVAGGLEVDELGGGKQTLGLRFKGNDGLTYQFRSIVKTPERAIPSPLLRTPIDEVLQDQMAAQFPLGALVVAELLEPAGILVAKPTPIIMPDDPRLGEYREFFVGRMGWLEVRPNEREGDRPGFAGSTKVTGTEALFERLRESPSDYVDQRKLVRARLIDMLVHDWDRHMDQWRWASFEEGDRVRWEPIPRDRDWAFSTIDGILPRVSAVYFPQYTGFNDPYPGIKHLTWSAQLVDRTLLTGLEREVFMAEAEYLQGLFTRELIEGAVRALPPEYVEAVGDELVAGLVRRRDQLSQIASDFYGYLAEWVDVFGTEGAESVAVARLPGGDLRVTMEPTSGGPTTYDRTFHPEETREVRLYLLDGDDRVHISGAGEPRIRVNLVPGDGDDHIEDDTSGDRIGVYGHAGDDEFELGGGAWVTDRFRGEEAVDDAYLTLSRRDWGSNILPRPELAFNSDQGPFIGASVTRYGYGFQYYPYRSRYQIKAMNGFDADQWIGSMEFERPFSNGEWRIWADANGHTELPTRFFGFGNETEAPGSTSDYIADRSSVSTRVGVRFRPDDTWSLTVGPVFTASGAVQPGSRRFDELRPYGSGRFLQAGLMAEGRYDRRDSQQLPTSGFLLGLSGKLLPPLFDVEETFGGGRTDLRGYVPLGDFRLEPVLHLRVVGEKVWGPTPFDELPFLGGGHSLPGLTRRRFLGNSMAAGHALLRARVLQFDRLSGLDVGVHALGATGRVWLDGEQSDRWHTSAGGGVWVFLRSIERTLSVTFARSEEDTRAYLDFGFLF